jgi:hypothetical protein
VADDSAPWRARMDEVASFALNPGFSRELAGLLLGTHCLEGRGQRNFNEHNDFSPTLNP